MRKLRPVPLVVFAILSVPSTAAAQVVVLSPTHATGTPFYWAGFVLVGDGR